MLARAGGRSEDAGYRTHQKTSPALQASKLIPPSPYTPLCALPSPKSRALRTRSRPPPRSPPAIRPSFKAPHSANSSARSGRVVSRPQLDNPLTWIYQHGVPANRGDPFSKL